MDHDALIDAQTHNTRSHAYSFATSVVPSVCVCLLAIMATSRFALATTTGRPKGEDPNALKSFNIIYQVSLIHHYRSLAQVIDAQYVSIVNSESSF